MDKHVKSQKQTLTMIIRFHSNKRVLDIIGPRLVYSSFDNFDKLTLTKVVCFCRLLKHLRVAVFITNSVETDQIVLYEQSDLGSHCLPITYLSQTMLSKMCSRQLKVTTDTWAFYFLKNNFSLFSVICCFILLISI